MANFEVVYDAARLPFPAWPVALAGAVVAAIGVGIGAYLRRRPRASPTLGILATSAVVFGASWALLVGGGLYAQHAQLRKALREGSFVRVEGRVYDRPPGGAGAKNAGSAAGDELRDAADASWVVESGEIAHWYRYESSPLAVGYRRSAPGTGGITSGAQVRIADIGGRIARLEVQR